MRLVATALLTLIALSTHAAEVPWPARWKAGDKAVYDVERCRKVSGSGKPVDTCVKGQIEIEVLRAEGKGTLQRWKSDSMLAGLANSGLPAEVMAAMGRASSVSMDIEFDDLAQPVRLVNAAEVRTSIDKVAGSITAAGFRSKGLDPQLAPAMKALLAQATRTDERLLALVARDATLLYSPLGGILPVGETRSVRSSMPSPFDSAPVESTIAVSASVSAQDAQAFELRLEEEVDRAALLGAMDKMVKPMTDAAGRADAAAEMRKFLTSTTMRHTSIYKVRPENPWAASLQWRQTTQTGDQVKVDSVEFKRAH